MKALADKILGTFQVFYNVVYIYYLYLSFKGEWGSLFFHASIFKPEGSKDGGI